MKGLWILMSCFLLAISLIGCASDPEPQVRITMLDKPVPVEELEKRGMVPVGKPVKGWDKDAILKLVKTSSYNERGAQLIDAGKHEQALPEINKALAIDPDFGPALYNRAIIYYQKGEYNKAWEDVTKAEKVGYKVNPNLLGDIRKASGRNK